MKKNKIITILCLSVLCCTLSGCFTYHGKDDYEYQPWTGSKTRAKGYYTLKDYIETYEDKFEWEVQNKKSIDSNDVVKLCDNFLNRNNLWVEPKYIPIPVDHRYVWGIPEIGLSHSTVTKMDNGKVVSVRQETHRIREIGYDTIKTIVCINPIVVISVPGNIVYYDYFITASPNRLKETGFNVCGNNKGLYLILPRGYAYGTRMPYDPKPTWFSPDLNVTPRSIEIGNDGKGRIAVPWGNLVLNKENDEWVVTTESKN